MNIKKNFQKAKATVVDNTKALTWAVKWVSSLSGTTKVAIAAWLFSLGVWGTVLKSGYDWYLWDPNSKAESSLLLDLQTSQEAFDSDQNMFSVMDDSDQEDIIALCKKYNIPAYLYSKEDGSYYIDNDSLLQIKDLLIIEFTREQWEAKNNVWQLLIALAAGSLALWLIRRQHDKQDKAILKMKQDSIKDDISRQMSQIKLYLSNSLPQEAWAIEMLFEMISYPDLNDANHDLESMYQTHMISSQNKIPQIQWESKSIHDIVSLIMWYDHSPSEIDWAAIITEQLMELYTNHKIAQNNINPNLWTKLRELLKIETKLQENIKLVKDLTPIEWEKIQKVNVTKLLENAKTVIATKEDIEIQKKLLKEYFEQIRIMIWARYEQKLFANQQAVNQITQDQEAQTIEYTNNKAKIEELIALSKDREQNKETIVSSIFPEASDEDQAQAQTKFREYKILLNQINTLENKLVHLLSSNNSQDHATKDTSTLENQLSDSTKALLTSSLSFKQAQQKLWTIILAVASETMIEVATDAQWDIITNTLNKYIIKNEQTKQIAASEELMPYFNQKINNPLSDQWEIITVGELVDLLINMNQQFLLLTQIVTNQRTASNQARAYDEEYNALTRELEDLKAKVPLLENEVKEYAVGSSEIELDNHKKQVLSQALTNTIEKLGWDRQQHTPDQIYETLFREVLKIDPQFVPQQFGIKQLNNQTPIDPSIIRKFLFDLWITAATSSMVYHTMRSLLNILPSHPGLLGHKMTEFLTGGDGLLDPQNIPLFLTSVWLWHIAHKYIKLYNTRMAETQEFQMSWTISAKEIFWNNLTKTMHACMATYCLLLWLDLIWVAAAGASTVIKEKNANVTGIAYNNLASNTWTFDAFVAWAMNDNQEWAIKTITDEANEWGAWPLTANKFILTYKLWSDWYEQVLSEVLAPKKVDGFDTELTKGRITNLESINQAFGNRMNETKKLMNIVRDGKQISWDQIPNYMKWLESGLADVNTANQVDDVKTQFKKSAQTVVAKLKQDLQRYAQETNKLNGEYQKIGGQPISIQPIDQKITDQQIASITAAADKFIKSLDGSVTYFDLSAQWLTDMVDTLSDLSLSRQIGIWLWMSIVSLLAISLAVFKLRQTKNTLTNKNNNSKWIPDLIKDSREEFEFTMSQYPWFDTNTITGIINEDWIQETIHTNQVNIDQEMGTFVYTSDLKATANSIPIIKQLFKDSLYDSYETYSSPYSDWVLKHHNYNENQLRLIMLDLFANSPTFREKMIKEIELSLDEQNRSAAALLSTQNSISISNDDSTNTPPVVEWTQNEVEWTQNEVEWTQNEVEWSRMNTEWTQNEVEWTQKEEEWTQKEEEWTQKEEEWTQKEEEWTQKEEEVTWRKNPKKKLTQLWDKRPRLFN